MNNNFPAVNLIPLINTVLSKELQAFIYFLGYLSQKNSFKIYATGGFVRDLILGRENLFIDLLIENSATDFARILGDILPAGRLQIDDRIGTARLFLPQGIVFDMVTAREDFYSLSSSIDDAKKSALKNELYKKNFTINTMACALNPREFGWLYDFFAGKDDLGKGLLRVLYGLSFVDDPCRMLQAVRLEQRFDLNIEAETKTLWDKARNSSLLKKISKEKLYSEARLIFLEPSPLKVLRRLEELNLFKVIFPRLVLNERTKFKLQRLEQIFAEQRIKRVPGAGFNFFVLFLTAFFDELNGHDLLYFCYILRLKRKEREKIVLVREKLQPLLDTLWENRGRGKENERNLINSWCEKYIGANTTAKNTTRRGNV